MMHHSPLPCGTQAQANNNGKKLHPLMLPKNGYIDWTPHLWRYLKHDFSRDLKFKNSRIFPDTREPLMREFGG
jgi:hypothetical protein